MQLLTTLSKIAENAHHQVSMTELFNELPAPAREAILSNSNSQLRELLGGKDVNYPDRDKVTTIKSQS